MPNYQGDGRHGHQYDSTMTMYEAQMLLHNIGMSVTAKPTGEFRVSFKDGPWKGEDHAYYTSSLRDAIGTAQDMARRLDEHLAMTKPVDPRDPDYSRSGVFQTHNCWRCDSGARPCVKGNPRDCETLHARND